MVCCANRHIPSQRDFGTSLLVLSCPLSFLYFSKNGWYFNHPVTKPAAPAADESIIELSTYEGNEYWQVFPNFKVIKRYNNSNKYAMAVHQLAQAIKQRY